MVTLIKDNVGGDVFIREDLTRPYDAESVLVVNGGATVLVLPAGHPMVGPVAATVAEVTSGIGTPPTTVDSFVLQTTRIPVGESYNVAVLAKPEGVAINRDALPATDSLGTPWILEELPNTYVQLGYVVRFEPAEISVQSD